MPILATANRSNCLSASSTDSSYSTASLEDVSTAITAILGMQSTPEFSGNAFRVFIKQFKRKKLSC